MDSPDLSSKSPSRRRAPMNRRALDGSEVIDDPLSRPTSSAGAGLHHEVADRPLSARADNTHSSPRSRPISSRPTSAIATPRSAHGLSSVDVSFLTRPSLYRSVPVDPHFSPHTQPPSNAELDELLETGHYRHAALKAASRLTSGAVSPEDTSAILSLYQTRLACLLLSFHSSIATQEVRPLLEWLSHYASSSARAGEHVDRYRYVQHVHWELRILLHKVQVLVVGDGRRSIMALYQMGSECRSTALLARKRDDMEGARVWESRLARLGIMITRELLEMGELETARRHLESLPQADSAGIQSQKAMLYVRLGDRGAARACLESSMSDDTDATIDALISMIEHDYAVSLTALTKLHVRHPTHELVTRSLAVCFLYTGHSDQASEVLTSFVASSGESYASVLCGLGIDYDFSPERARLQHSRTATKALGAGAVGVQVTGVHPESRL